MRGHTRRTFLASSAAAAGGAILHRNLMGAAIGAQAGEGSLTATIDANQTGQPITKYMYGMFLEHAGNLVYRSLWSEMLDDRKFYYPVNSIEEKEVPETTGRPGSRLRKWRPIGPDEFVVMDREHAYVGSQTPMIRLEGATQHGIQQSGLVLQNGKDYTGRIVLAATPAAKIEVSLVWGPGPNDRQTIAISNAHAGFAKFPLKFNAKADSTAGRLEIAATGTGSFRIGAVSLMPADNIHGFRPDTIQLLRDLNSGMYRLPGGNSLSDHDWRDAIGDPDQRPPTFDYAFRAMQPNDVGTDEFMTMCKLLNVEPYITVSAGFADPRSAAELVEYANGPTSTRMGALRASNGHPQPYNVKYWNIGNEMYGYWQIGHTYIRYYALKHNFFAEAMRRADPSITILACGAMPDEMTVTGNARLATGKTQAEYGTEGDWTGGLLAYSSGNAEAIVTRLSRGRAGQTPPSNPMGNFDALTEHWYCHNGQRFDHEVGDKNPFPLGITTEQSSDFGFVPVTESMLEWARRPSNRVRLKAEAWAEYKKRFPVIDEKKIFLSIDEWGYFGARTNLKLALSFAMAMHEMFRHTDFMKMSAFTFGPSCLNYNTNASTYNTTGLMFKLYRDHFGTLPIEVTGNSPQPAPKWPVGGDQPKINAGSPTFPLDVVAALTSDRKSLTVAVVNCTESAQQLALDIKGLAFSGKPRMWQLTGPDSEAAVVVGEEAKVKMAEVPLTETPKTLSVPPVSISLYTLPVA